MSLKIVLSLCLTLFISCQRKQASSPPVNPAEKKAHHFSELKSKIGEIKSFDGNRLLETETAFFIDSSLIVARLSPLIEASRVEIKTWTGETFSCNSFVAIDRTNDFIILKSEKNISGGIILNPSFIDTIAEAKFPTAPENNILSVKVGKIFPAQNINGAFNYKSSFSMYSKTYGSPIFVNDTCIGIGFSDVVEYDKLGLCIPSPIILKALENSDNKARPFAELKSQTDKETSLANSQIKGLLIETSMGNITIKLFNETPVYRDNFIALVREQYYDSLLIHRVIPGFCIQSGAADTKYAKDDDIVGWRGPGYTLPAHIVPLKFHKRGMIGSPRKPDTMNKEKRSDGSQFYIVTGRRYSSSELDAISKETGYKFSSSEREYYRTIGGAPHVDGSYTIFGEVISGMDVADKINSVAVDKDYRPMKDVRIKRVRVME
ncbi:MAG: peptidylprolyl isomerase [Mangrovibacterium sp.]